MSNTRQAFQLYASAVDALLAHFGDQREALASAETRDQYDFTTQVDGVAWLKENLSPLADRLLLAQFEPRVTVTLRNFRAELQIRRSATRLEVDYESADVPKAERPDALPDQAAGAFVAFRDTLEAGKAGLPLSEVYSHLEALAAGGAQVDQHLRLQLHLFLDKTTINKQLASQVKTEAQPKVTSFLFPQALARTLQDTLLTEFEDEFCVKGQRTVIPVFGFTGCLEGEILAVCGRGHETKLDAFLTEPLSRPVLQRASESLEFRQQQSLWEFPTTWLTPEAFAVTATLPAGDEIGAELGRQLKGFQALLSAIFLADYVECRDRTYRVEYRGDGRARFYVPRVTLLEYETKLGDLYRLYAYAYQGGSADKLGIARQFLSLMAVDLRALCTRASEIQGATETTYARVLQGKVRDYFAARQQVQERIKTAVAETSDSVISLTREVSADLYKIAGLIAAAVVGALLKPDLSLWAALVASLVIAAYMGLVIFYHLATLGRAYELGMLQHKTYIQSFKKVLDDKEIETYQVDIQVKNAEAMFSEKRKWAARIYAAFLTLSLLVAVICIWILLWQFLLSVLHALLLCLPAGNGAI